MSETISIPIAEQMLDSFEKRIEYRKTHPAGPSEQYYCEIMLNYFRRIVTAKPEGKTLVGISGAVPREILFAMDLVPFFGENLSMLVSAQGKSTPFFGIGEGYGIPNEGCSLYRLEFGLARSGLLPHPDLLINVGANCNANSKSYEVLSHLYGCSNYFLDCPSGSAEEDFRYYGEEIERMIAFLEQETGRKLDRGRLQEVVELSHQAHDLFCQICRLRTTVPAPTGVRDLGRDTALMTIGAGLPETVRYFEDRYREVKEKADRQEGIVSNERYRVAWWSGMPCFDMRVFNWIEEEYGAVVVLDINDPVTFNSVAGEDLGGTSDPLAYLVRKTFKSTGRRFTSRYPEIREDVIRSCQERKVNSSVFFTNFGCKQGNAISRIITDELKGRLGVSTLMLDGDLLDARVASSTQLKEKLREYFEMLAAQKG